SVMDFMHNASQRTPSTMLTCSCRSLIPLCALYVQGIILAGHRFSTGKVYYDSWLALLLPFFFQAEDGIRGFHVTGVQTCALPISADERDRKRDRRGTSLRRRHPRTDHSLLLRAHPRL